MLRMTKKQLKAACMPMIVLNGFKVDPSYLGRCNAFAYIETSNGLLGADVYDAGGVWVVLNRRLTLSVMDTSSDIQELLNIGPIHDLRPFAAYAANPSERLAARLIAHIFQQYKLPFGSEKMHEELSRYAFRISLKHNLEAMFFELFGSKEDGRHE